MKTVILAGGYGKRLRPLTENKPKAMVEVCGRPIIELQIRWLKKYGINDFVILLGYAKEKIIEHLGSGHRFGISVSYVIEDEPLGTGGAIKNAESILRNEDVFLVINGDIITDIDPRPLINEVINDKKSVAGIALVYMRSPYGIVKVEDGYVNDFVEKPILDYTINAGIYVMKPSIFSYLPLKGDIETLTFPRLASQRLLRAWIYKDVFWKSIDTIKDIEECENTLKQLYPDLCKT